MQSKVDDKDLISGKPEYGSFSSLAISRQPSLASFQFGEAHSECYITD